MDSVRKGFGGALGVILAIVVLFVCIICACLGGSAVFTLNDPTVNKTFENVVKDIEQRPAPGLPTLTPTAAGPTPTPVILKFQGSGDDIVNFTAVTSGLAQFSLSHRGSHNFAVKLLRSNGDYIDLLVNDIGDYDGKGTAKIEAGQYVLDITADGNWAVIVAPPQ